LLLAKLKVRLSSFEEQFSAVSEKMADILQGEEDWKGAAELLSRIPLTSSQRHIEDEYKAKMYVRIAMLYLEDDDETNADTFVGRSHVIIGKSEFTNLEVKFQHQACRARIYDAKRKFQDAARHYYELSQVGKATVMAIMGEEAASQANLEEVIEAQNLDALTKAAICAILAPAGPARSRILALLYKDERTQKIATYNMMQKIYMERVVRAPEIKQFEKSLRPHQMAITSDGLTVLQKAMIEHNLFAAAKMYNNITFVELGFFLHVESDKAEKIARNMILEDRIAGSIDQIDGMIYFAQVRPPPSFLSVLSSPPFCLCSTFPLPAHQSFPGQSTHNDRVCGHVQYLVFWFGHDDRVTLQYVWGCLFPLVLAFLDIILVAYAGLGCT